MQSVNVICASKVTRQIRQGLQMTRSLYVSSILIGPPATGKKTLVRSLFPKTPMIDGRDKAALTKALEMENELIITSFEAIAGTEDLDFQNKRIIALADKEPNRQTIDDFAFIYRMPPLKERPEDLKAYVELFLAEARKIFPASEALTLNPAQLDLSDNLRSLRSSVYREVLTQTMDARDIETALFHFFVRTLEGNNAYRENLGILERPLLKAGLQRYGSQLKLSEILGINRNTLRKKLHEYRID